MNIRCLFGHHDWKFAYNHGMPHGIDTNGALRMFEEGKTYAVDECTRCRKQSRFCNGERVTMSRSEMENP